MRSDTELLTLLRDRTPALLSIDGGLWRVIGRLYYNQEIDDNGYLRIDAIVRKHGPRRLKYSSYYRWKRGNLQPRIKWINKMLNRLEGGEQL